MSDPAYGDRFATPTDKNQIPTPSLSTRRPGFSASPSGEAFAPTGVAGVDQYMADWQIKNFGRALDRPDADLLAHIQKTVTSSNLYPQPVYLAEPSPGLDPYVPSDQPLDIVRLVKHGFSGSTMGAMQRWAATDGAIQFKSQAGYDPFVDPTVTKGPFADRPWLFANVGSEQEAAWLSNYMQRYKREAEYLSRMPGGEVFTTAGGLLGDPLAWTPATLGFKAARTAAETAMLSAPGNVALGLRPVVWGGIGDSLRAATAQAAVALTDAGLHHTLDPSHENGSIADIVALPAAIGAAVGLFVGGHARYKLGQDAYRRAASDTGFLGGTRPRSRQMDGGEGPMAPGELSAKEREYWDKATAKNPDGRFAIDGQVIGHADDGVIFRTSEGLETVIPTREIDQTSAKGAKGIIVSATELMRQDVLKTSAYHLDGSFMGGNTRMPAIHNPLDATIRPGSLATDYAHMRTEEAAQSGFIPRERADFTHFMRGNAVVDAAGQPVPFYHGTRNVFMEFDPERTGSRFGTGSHDNPMFWFTNHPGEAGAYAEGTALRGGDTGDAPNVRKVYLRATNPADITDLLTQLIEEHPDYSKVAPHMADIARGEGDAAARVLLDKIRHEAMSDAIDYIKSQGHDAAVLRGSVGIGVEPGQEVQQFVVFDKKQIKHLDERYDSANPASQGPASLDDVNISRGSLSAGNLETDVHSRKAQLAGNRQVSTGVGIENLGLDVWSRASNSMLTTWQTTVADMISSSGRVLVKNTAAGGHQMSGNPVEMLIRVNWNKPTNDVVREIRDMWEMARTGSNPVDPTDAHRIGFELKTTISDWWNKKTEISHEQFRRRVGDAMINADKDLLSDANTPFIEQAAAKTRVLWEKIKREAMDVGMFRDAHEEQVLKAEARLAAARKGDNADSLKAAEIHLAKVQQLLSDVITGGPSVKTAKSYRPRVWLQDQLRDRAIEFKDIVDDWLRQKNPNMSPKERADAATNIHETLTRDRPVWTKEEVDKHFEDLSNPGSAKARTFEIPDMLVKDFLENDIESLVRSHSRSMGTGIEMHRRFGSTGMEEQIADIWRETQLLMKSATTNAEKKAIQADYKLAVSDLQATRDRLYGVYGAPDDPHRWQSRAVRMAKQFTNLTVLGMSGVTAMGDLVRPLMTEGLQAVHDYGYRTLASEARSTILKMSRQELELAGDAMELIANTRALSMSDAGDMFRSRTPFERGLAKANSWYFVMNGLNMINQMDKEWAGVIIQGKMNRAILDLGRALEVEPDMLVKFGDKTAKLPHGVEPWMITRLAVNGIDADMIRRMAKEMNFSSTAQGVETAGSSRFGKLVLAHTDNWQDEVAQQTYRSALNQMVNRTVPTPTLGDTPNWFSSELGSLMTQYKAFSFGAMNRTLISGLQEQSGGFWYGAAAMTGFALLLNEVRSRWMYDRSTFDKPMTGVLMDAVDRSSILGWFSDANKAIEVLTGHRGGIRPWTGGETARTDPSSRIVSTLAGPAAGQGVTALTVLGDALSLHPTVKTLADARQLVPGQNLPYTDPFLDRLLSDGKRYPAHEPKVNRRGGPQADRVQP